MKMLLYSCKAKPYLVKRNIFAGVEPSYFTLKENVEDNLNGKIVAECDFEVEKLQIVYDKGWETKTIKGTENIEKLTCLSREKLYQYCKGNGYAIYIKNLHIFDKSISLNQLKDRNMNIVKNAPQNMMYINCIETGNKVDLTDKILISIKPEWLCKILNGEKKIEVRKKVLKEMIQNE